jgi:hypothetical protein
MLLVLILLIIIILIFSCSKSNLISSDTITTKLKKIKNKLKTGDLMVVADNEDYVRKMYLLVKQSNGIKVVNINTKGKVILDSIEKVTKKQNGGVYILSLLRPLTDLQEGSVRKLLMRNYAGYGESNCVLRYDKRQYFYGCDAYIINIMAQAGILGIGPAHDCLNNSDPRCLQQFYDTSIFINGGLFNNAPYLIKAHPAE